VKNAILMDALCATKIQADVHFVKQDFISMIRITTGFTMNALNVYLKSRRTVRDRLICFFSFFKITATDVRSTLITAWNVKIV
jgi:hypothetical protein